MVSDALQDKLQRVTVHGPTISLALYAITVGGAPCDGLLFGETTKTTTQYLRDDDDAATATESRATISSVLCCTATGSFYDEAGAISESRLEDLARHHSGPLLGWMSFRPVATGSQLRPSMREREVTEGLLRRQLERHAGRQAVLLLLLSCAEDHNGATLTWQYRCFQARHGGASGGSLLEPVELHTLNLAGHTGHAAYGELGTSSSSTPAGANFTTAAITTTAAAGTQAAHPMDPAAAAAARPTNPALAALAAGARQQVAAVTKHCELLLAELHGLCSQAVAGEEALAALRLRRDTLLAQLAQRAQ